MKFIAAALVVALLASTASAAVRPTASNGLKWPPMPASCTGPKSGTGGVNCTDRPANISVHTAAPVFVKSVKNGMRYMGGSGNDTFHVAHLYSDTDDLYEMGFALGQMFPEEISDMFDSIIPWLAERLEMAVPSLPKWLADVIIKEGAPVALDLLYDIVEKYIPEKYKQEWEGIAAGANCSIEAVKRVSLFPQATKAACTIMVAHQEATATGGVNHLRALDFAPLSYVADFSSVVIYHYKNLPQLANFGWIGMTGVLTGMNDVPMTVGEKAWGGHNSPYFSLPTGLPWMQMLRESLERRNLTAVNAYMDEVNNKNAAGGGNSVSIHLGYGDQSSSTNSSIIGYEVGYNYIKPFNWSTQTPTKKNPLYKGIVYWTKNSDARTMCPADMLNHQYGNIDAEWMAMYYSPNDKTGDTQMAAFDLKEMKVWYANSRKSWVSNTTDEPLCAYYRQRTILDMAALFATKPNATEL